MTEPPVSIHPLELTEAVALLHALTDRVARDHDIRLLAIKGPIATTQGVRPARVSADLDLLVDPARFADFCTELARLGWTAKAMDSTDRALPIHSATYQHPGWPCEIDAHHIFPGFFADSQLVFDTLWSRRTLGGVANRAIPCPDPIAQAAIMGLHSLRNPAMERSKADLSHLLAFLERELDTDERRQLADLAAVTGAADTLAPVLSSIRAPRVGLGSTDAVDLADWRIQTFIAGRHSARWVIRLRGARLREWPRLLTRAMWLSDEDMRLRQPLTGPGRRHLVHARLIRLGEGLRDLPRAIRIVRPWNRRPR